MMSVRHSLLALLERRPMYGYGLKGEFEAATGHMWPLNDGQVYTTLARLERDGLAEAGRRELDGWFLGPLVRDAVPRQELALKLVFAVRSPSVDVHRVIQRQRAATMRSLQELTRLKGDGQPGDDLSWLLVLDSMLFQAEAEVRWLDHCEASLVRYSPPPARVAPEAPEPATEVNR